MFAPTKKIVVDGYVRVSTEDQAKNGVSQEQQIEKIVAYVKANAETMKLGKIHVDKGISSKIAMVDRPGGSSLVARLDSGEAHMVLIAKPDRAFRTTVEMISTFDDWSKRGIQFKSLDKLLDIDTRTPTGKLMLTLIAALAEFERNLISERTKASLDHVKEKLKDGPQVSKRSGRTFERLGNPRLGHEHSKKLAAAKQKRADEEAILDLPDFYRVIRDLHNRGQDPVGYVQIADELNARKIYTRRGFRWSGSTVFRLLKRFTKKSGMHIYFDDRYRTDKEWSLEQPVIPQTVLDFVGGSKGHGNIQK